MGPRGRGEESDIKVTGVIIAEFCFVLQCLVMEFILDFSILRGTKPQILTPERYDDHPGHV